MESSNSEWRELKIFLPESEEYSALLFELGVQGIELLENNLLRCFVENRDNKIQLIEDFLATYSGKLINNVPVKLDGWIEGCQELQTPIKIGQLEFIPEHIASSGDQAIIIRYGCGFGTGHHAATQMVIEHLQEHLQYFDKTATALDIGTGSGILALAITKLLAINVVAIDNDPLAIQNAVDNVEINQCGSFIHVSNKELQSIEGQFTLIVANLYAEVLCQLADSILAHLQPDGLLIMSGIKDELCKDVEQSFADLKILAKKSRDGWSSLLVRKI